MNLESTDYLSESSVRFLQNVSWGTKGLVFKILNIRERVSQFENISVFSLTSEEDNEVIALLGFLSDQTEQNGHKRDAYIVRFLAVSESLKGKGGLRTFYARIAEELQRAVVDNKLMWCFVESKNVNSVRIVERMDFVPVAKIRTIGFSRLRLHAPVELEKVVDDQKKTQVVRLLRERYKNHELAHFGTLFSGDGYFAWWENGEMIAGVQVNTLLCEVQQLSGIEGFVAKWILPVLPVFRKAFDMKKFKCLTTEFLYYKEGRSADFIKLMESVLAKLNVHCALLWLDEKSPAYSELSRLKGLGLLNSLVRSTDSQMYMHKRTLDNRLTSSSPKPFLINSSEMI